MTRHALTLRPLSAASLPMRQLLHTQLHRGAAMAAGLEAIAGRALDDGEASHDQLEHLAELSGHLKDHLGELRDALAELRNESA